MRSGARVQQITGPALSVSRSTNTGMEILLRRADELRIGDRVQMTDGAVLTVTSTRLQGVGPGVVSVGFAERPARFSYRAGDAMRMLITSIRRAG